MQRQRGGVLTLFLITLVILAGVAFMRYQQVANVSSSRTFEMLHQQLKTDLLKGDLRDIYDSLGAVDLKAIAGRMLSMAREEVVITGVSAARPLLAFSDQGETRYRVDFNIEEAGQIKGQGTRYLRFVEQPDQNPRYMGTSDSTGFYRFYLSRSGF